MEEDEEIIDIGVDVGSDEDQEMNVPMVFTDESPLVNQDMDSESRQLIEQMLAEEEFYYGKSSISKPKNTRTIKKKKSVLSSSALPSHKTRWSKEEDDKLLEAFDKFGYGNWKLIAEFLGTRNGLQCKNHARHLLLAEKIKAPTKLKKEEDDTIEAKVVEKDIKDDTEEDTKEDTKDDSKEDMEEDTEKDMEYDAKEDMEEKIKEDTKEKTKEDTKEKTKEDMEKDMTKIMKDSMKADLKKDTTEKVNQVQEIKPELILKSKEEPNGTKQLDTTPREEEDGDDLLDIGDTIVSEESVVIMKEVDPESPSMEQETTEKIESVKVNKAPVERTENVSLKKEEEKLVKEADNSPDRTTDIPHEHPMFNRYYVSEEEMMDNPEWFRHKHTKTPDRYLRIRNHILDCWYKCRPRYLAKTMARKELRDCGDVNAIGRVHTYLEDMGAINVDCVTRAPRPPKRIPRETIVEEEEMFEAPEFVVNYDGPRKRKVRNEHGDWVDPKELEGRVIEHGVPVVENEPKAKKIRKSFHQHYYTGDDFNRGYDPFRLVPTSHYNDILLPPFEVEIVSDALLVMDFHAHLAHTEIIGLLGGNFIKRSGTKVLQIKSVFPCKSTSTGIQCEMDPASEMRAREVFAEQGYNVVGWYHSHPTFEPHPSIRDIENQTSYQTLFREGSTGDEPFVGVIVTPYNAEAQSEHSQFQYLHISKEWDESHSYRKFMSTLCM
ncbi:unnamed protein product [Rhizopus stolonifer]